MDFLTDFWRHLGPSRALNDFQNDAKIVQKSMPKSRQNVKLLEKAPRRPKTAPRRPQGAPKTAPDTLEAEKWKQNGTYLASTSTLNLILCQNSLKATKTLFSLYIFNNCLPMEALFSKPKTVENRQQNHVSLVEALSCVRRTLKSAQNAPKMRRDGPDERFGSVLRAKMAPQNAPKSKKNPPGKQSKNIMQKACRKIIIPRKTGRNSTMTSPTRRPPSPSILASPGKKPTHIFEIPSLSSGGKPPSFPAISGTHLS